MPAAEWWEFCAHVLPGNALASYGQSGGCCSHFCFHSRPSSLSMPQPPSQDCRLPIASWAISMYDKCQVCRQANLVSALPRWGPGLCYHWKIIYRCEKRIGKMCQSGWEKMTPIFPPLFFFWPEGSRLSEAIFKMWCKQQWQCRVGVLSCLLHLAAAYRVSTCLFIYPLSNHPDLGLFI